MVTFNSAWYVLILRKTVEVCKKLCSKFGQFFGRTVRLKHTYMQCVKVEMLSCHLWGLLKNVCLICMCRIQKLLSSIKVIVVNKCWYCFILHVIKMHLTWRILMEDLITIYCNPSWKIPYLSTYIQIPI